MYNEPTSYTSTGQETPLGLKRNAPVKVEDVKMQSVVQSLKDKLASALSLRVFTEDQIAKAPEEWQKFLSDYTDSVKNIQLGALNPLQDALARLVTSEGGYIGGSSAIKIQLPDGSFRETGDVDLYTNDQSKVGTIADKALAVAKAFYVEQGLNPRTW